MGERQCDRQKRAENGCQSTMAASKTANSSWTVAVGSMLASELAYLRLVESPGDGTPICGFPHATIVISHNSPTRFGHTNDTKTEGHLVLRQTLAFQSVMVTLLTSTEQEQVGSFEQLRVGERYGQRGLIQIRDWSRRGTQGYSRI